ncbi:histone deacetylase [Cryptosporidium ubiquitum]|uniref:Histone deacetylase n=1 Tax=Cryptosporidium ubiquitum TaxID=857276 RepID=A0A1J4MDM2_9CRYT|nr:histone deacetylase [Cryptosporidium ubiquitum]OII70973.1 histone deacetylase [Cryptosporidium ubiquitum]
MDTKNSLNDHQLNIDQSDNSLANIPAENNLNLTHLQNNSQNIDILTINADNFNNDDNINNHIDSSELNIKVTSDQKSTNQSDDFGSRSNLDQLIKHPLLDNFNPKPGLFQKLIHSRDSKTLKEYIFSPMRCIINERDASGCTALHIALLNAYPEMLEILLSCQSEDLKSNNNVENTAIAGDTLSHNGYQNNMIPIDLSIPYAGIPISHLVLCKAIFPERYDDCLNCLYLLLPFTLTHSTSQNESWLDINATDQLGLTALHLACSFGDSKIVSLLLEYGALANISDLNNNEPVHYAISSRDPVTLSVILSSGGADPLKESTCTANLIKCCIDKSAWRCLHTLLTDSEYQQHPISESEYDLLSFHAQKLGLGSEFERVFSLAIEIASNDEPSQRGGIEGGNESFIVDGPAVGLASTRIFTHSCCIDHIALPEPMDMPIRRSKLVNKTPENPTRMEVLVKPNVGILKSSEFSLLQWTESCKPAVLSDILRVHDWAYVRLLQHKIEESRLIWDQKPYLTGSIDDDTQITPGSWKAALHASGSVISAVDCICRGENRNAFCAIRPPGHHLGTWGAAQKVGTDEGVPSGSQGFCLLNNVAIGAAYCRYMYSSSGISKIAIVDFDVHHGNGTEQIVRNVAPKSRTIKTLVNPVPGVNLNFEQDISYYKIWRDELDAENIFFSSIHAYDGTFYPGTGPDQCISKPNIINIGLSEKSNSKIFRSKIKRFLLPKLLQFRPDIIFISAGFDGHAIDIVGKGFISCTEGDYAWITQQLISIANLCCNGRIVSVLEGGYNTKALTLSPLARSVAAHVRTLQWTSPNLMPNPQEWEDEILTEDNEDEDLENEDDDMTSVRGSGVFDTYVDSNLVAFGNSDIGNSDNLNYSSSSNHYVFGAGASCSPSLKRYKSQEKGQVDENPHNNNSSSSAGFPESQVRSYEVNIDNKVANINATSVIRPRRAAAIKAEESIQKKIQSELDSSKQINDRILNENI